MSKQITPAELANIVAKLLTDSDGLGELLEATSYASFFQAVAEAVCDHCGGEVTSSPDQDMGEWLIGIIANDSLPEGGGVWAKYDPEGELEELSMTCSACGEKVDSVIGCPSGVELCQACFDEGNEAIEEGAETPKSSFLRQDVPSEILEMLLFEGEPKGRSRKEIEARYASVGNVPYLVKHLGVQPATEGCSSVKVKPWDAYNQEGESTEKTHQFDITDQRHSNGQVYLDLGALEGDPDDMLSVTMEVSTNPLNGIDAVPCAHIHFNGDSLAVSLFKIGSKILLRQETGVTIRSESLRLNGSPFLEACFWID